MTAQLRTLATLGVLGVALVVAGVWGWRAISEPFPERSDPPPCVDREVARGEKLTPRGVTVSVWNAGTRVGLAGLTMDLLGEAGFHEGTEGNTPGNREVERVQIWTEQPDSPAVRLVSSHLGNAEVVERATGVPGVLVVVGDGFEDVTRGRKQVRVREATTVCGPARMAGSTAG